MDVSASAKPERLEDLGRIREKLDMLFDECEAIGAGGMHDEYFMATYAKEDRLDDLRRSLRCLTEQLSDCRAIARGWGLDE